MGRKIDANQIKVLVQSLKNKYGFVGPLHFTDFTNLASIFRLGKLMSRGNCENENIKFLDVADSEVIGHTNMNVKKCVRFYFKERTPTLFVNEGIKQPCLAPHVPIPVYLEFDEEILYHDDTWFADGNAASIYTKFGRDYDFISNMDWDTIFSRGAILDVERKPYIIRVRQAELLSTSPVSLNYLNRVIFRCDTDLKRAKYKFGDNNRFVVDSSMFNCNNNYIKDYSCKIDKQDRKIIIEFSFMNYTYVNYRHYVVIRDAMQSIVYQEDLHFVDGSSLRWQYSTDKYQYNWKNFEYYMNGILCIEEPLS